jgi:hypothetical protein
MSRKNFEAIAKAINEASECDNTEELLTVLFLELSRHFSDENPQFDSSRFAKACGF